LLEELRVSLFAQELKTPYPVSVKRLQKRWDEIKPLFAQKPRLKK
jgi:ATP-dependent helicase HrpA